MIAKSFTMAVVTALAAPAMTQDYETNIPADHPAIGYWSEPPIDRVTQLANALMAEAAALEFDENGAGYLAAVLRHLDVTSDSQTLVYSKTSLQQSAISTRAPRAIYFSDDVAVAFVPGGDAIEMAGVDPRQGVMLYRLANRKTNRPRLARPKICLACHLAPATLGVAGVYVGSVLTTPSGRPRYAGSIVTDHRTPFEARWGGWYVTPHDALDSHRGNAVAAGPAGDGLTALTGKIDDALYPGSGSDVVALMVLEHQTLATNLIIRLGWEARTGAGDDQLDARIGELVRYLRFDDEPPLPRPISGQSSFAETFVVRGPHDRRGRSLRELDLQTRLFRHRLSYMVYSDVLRALPEDVGRRVHERLASELSDEGEIREILRATGDALPHHWNLPRR